MADDLDNRTPDQLDAYAREALRCAEDCQKQGADLLAQAQEWTRLAKEAQSKALERRSYHKEQRAAPSAAKIAEPVKAPKKAASKRSSKR